MAGKLQNKKVQKKKGQKKSAVKVSEVKREKKSTQTGEWLYFSPEEINIRDIYEIFADVSGAEVWEEAGVLEIPIGENVFDVEAEEIHPKDEVTLAFANEHQARELFLITFVPEDYDEAERMMRKILEKFGGIFCGDTEDFMPQIS